MARLRSLKFPRRSGDAEPATGSKLQESPELPGDEKAEPSPELPPVEIAAEEQLTGEAAADEDTAPEEREPKKKRGLRAGAKSKPRPPRPPVANLSRVRRERRTLMRERERRIRDLGGLMLEMYRRDQFREDLIVEHCAQAMGVENRIHELESVLARAGSGRGAPGPQCSCGAPLLFGARFCASCGRPTELAGTGSNCSRCRQPVADGAGFCSNCGAAVGGEAGASEVDEQTMEHAPLGEPGHGAERAGGGEA